MKKETNKNLIVDIFHPVVIRHLGLPRILNETSVSYNRQISGIVYPAWTKLGVTVAGIGLPTAPDQHIEEEADLISVAKFCKKNKIELYIRIDLNIDFLENAQLNLVSFSFAKSASCCPVNPLTRALIVETLKRIKRILDENELGAIWVGSVISIQDLWGSSASGGEINPTCFCAHCVQALSKHGFEFARIRSAPDAWKLLLHDAGSGISHASEISPSATTEDLISLSRSREFLASKLENEIQELNTQGRVEAAVERRSELEEYAHVIHDYMHAYDAVNRENLSAYLEAVREVTSESHRVSVICDNESYDWNSRMFKARLSEIDNLDEIWLEWSAQEMVNPPKNSRQILSRRGFYIMDSLFESLDQLTSRKFAALTGVETRMRYIQVGGTLRRALLSSYEPALSLVHEAAMELDGCNGQVCGALSPELLNELLFVKLGFTRRQFGIDDDGENAFSQEEILRRLFEGLG